MHPHHHHHHQQPPHHPPPPAHHQLDQYQMHSQMGGLMGEQQYGQWHPQTQPPTPESHMMAAANQTYHNLHSPSNHSTYHHLSSPNQQMLMMQPPPQQTHQQAPPPPQPNQHQQQPPQMSPQMSGNNYIGQSPPQNAPINSHENGSTSDDSDDTALNDPNVSAKFRAILVLFYIYFVTPHHRHRVLVEVK
jgi:hypothetical protein